jgi:hypothetical protein
MTDRDPLDDALASWRQQSAVPPSLTDRIADAAVRDFRFRRRVRRTMQSGAAAAVLLVIGLVIWSNRPVSDRAVPEVAMNRPVIDPVRTSNDLLTSMSRSIARETPRLTSAIDLPEPPKASPLAFRDPPTRLMAVPDSARRSIEPISATATQAARRFFSDFSSAFTPPKPG